MIGGVDIPGLRQLDDMAGKGLRIARDQEVHRLIIGHRGWRAAIRMHSQVDGVRRAVELAVTDVVGKGGRTRKTCGGREDIAAVRGVERDGAVGRAVLDQMVGQPFVAIDIRPLEQGEAEGLTKGDIDRLIDRGCGRGVIDRTDEQKGPVLDRRGSVRHPVPETSMTDKVRWAEEVRIRRECESASDRVNGDGAIGGRAANQRKSGAAHVNRRVARQNTFGRLILKAVEDFRLLARESRSGRLGADGDVGDVEETGRCLIGFVRYENQVKRGVGVGQGIVEIDRLVAVGPVTLLAVVGPGVGPVSRIVAQADCDSLPLVGQLGGDVISRIGPVSDRQTHVVVLEHVLFGHIPAQPHHQLRAIGLKVRAPDGDLELGVGEVHNPGRPRDRNGQMRHQTQGSDAVKMVGINGTRRVQPGKPLIEGADLVHDRRGQPRRPRTQAVVKVP